MNYVLLPNINDKFDCIRFDRITCHFLYCMYMHAPILNLSLYCLALFIVQMHLLVTLPWQKIICRLYQHWTLRQQCHLVNHVWDIEIHGSICNEDGGLSIWRHRDVIDDVNNCTLVLSISHISAAAAITLSWHSVQIPNSNSLNCRYRNFFTFLHQVFRCCLLFTFNL